MEPTVTLQQLTDRSASPSVLCRIVKTWDIIYPNSGPPRTMRYLLVNTEGTAIEAEISKADRNLLSVKPENGNVYLFRQFRVALSTGGYNATGHKYIIRMTKWTQACLVNNPIIEPPLFYFDFKEFEEIGTTIKGSRVVVDIIGRIASLGAIETMNGSNGPAEIRDVSVENIRGMPMRITFWTTFIPLIDEVALLEASNEAPVVYAFSSLKLRSYNREPFLKTYSATKIYTDQNQPDIAQYLKLFERRSYPITVLQPRTFQPLKPSKLTTPISLPLEDIINLEPYSNKDQQFSCLATIEGILNEDSWFYSACPECKASTYCDGDSTTCHKCHTTITSTIPWYHLRLHVTDKGAAAEFTLIGKQAENIINKKAELAFAESRHTSRMIPSSIESIYGKRFLFTVEINIAQLHNQRLTYDVNKVQPVPAMLPQTP